MTIGIQALLTRVEPIVDLMGLGNPSARRFAPILAWMLASLSLLGASFSIVPAGLGGCEGTAAFPGPVSGIADSSAFLAASRSRILGMAVTFPLALVLALKRHLQ